MYSVGIYTSEHIPTLATSENNITNKKKKQEI